MTLLTHLPCSRPSFLSPAAAAAAIMVVPPDLPTVLPGPGKQNENPINSLTVLTRGGTYVLGMGGLPVRHFEAHLLAPECRHCRPDLLQVNPV